VNRFLIEAFFIDVRQKLGLDAKKYSSMTQVNMELGSRLANKREATLRALGLKKSFQLPTLSGVILYGAISNYIHLPEMAAVVVSKQDTQEFKDFMVLLAKKYSKNKVEEVDLEVVANAEFAGE
jgi:hypothetical protein